MQHLSGATLDYPAYLDHLAALIDARQETALLQPVMQRLLALGQALCPCQGLYDLIAGRRLQEQITSDHPTDAAALRNPLLACRFESPPPDTWRFWRGA